MNSLKQLKIAFPNSPWPWAYIWEGLLSEGYCDLDLGDLASGGLSFGGA